MLVIPAIEIQNRRCIRTVVALGAAADDVYPDDPAAVARMWRQENAKSIHVTDFDGLYGGRLDNFDAIAGMAATIEIPLVLLSRFATIEECHQWLDAGVYRIVVHDLVIEEPVGVRALLEAYSPSRVVAGAITRAGMTCATWRSAQAIDSVEFAARAKALGFRRVFFTDREYEGVMRGPNFAELRRLAASTDLPITAAGGIATVEHLWRLQDLEPEGVDSVVIGRAFYENRFPCQELWRDVEVEKRRQANWKEGEISTSRLSPDRTGPEPSSDSQNV